jgi:hypothetical protein
MPNPKPFDIYVPYPYPDSLPQHAANWASMQDWSQRLAPTGRTQIYNNRLKGTTASVTFPIPVNFSHIHLIVNGIASGAVRFLLMRLNGDTGANYSDTRYGTTGGAAVVGNNAGATSMIVGLCSSGTRGAASTVTIPDYKFPQAHQVVWQAGCFDAGGGQQSYNGSGLHTQAATIRSITLLPDTVSFAANTLITAYGEF